MAENVAREGLADEAAVAALQADLRGTVLQPDDADYDAVRGIWNAMIDRRPRYIIRCHGVADVIAAVNFARTYGLQVAVRGGGHGVAGYAVCDGGVMIDLSEMRAVRVDPIARRAWVQGGATWGDVDCETTAFGLATLGGSVEPRACASTMSCPPRSSPPRDDYCVSAIRKIRISTGPSVAAAATLALWSASNSGCGRSNRP